MKMFPKFSKGNSNFIDKTLGNILSKQKNMFKDKAKNHRYQITEKIPGKVTYANPEGQKITYYTKDLRTPGDYPEIDDVAYILENLPKDYIGKAEIKMIPKAEHYRQYYSKKYPHITDTQLKHLVSKTVMGATNRQAEHNVLDNDSSISIFPIKGYESISLHPSGKFLSISKDLVLQTKKYPREQVPLAMLKDATLHEIGHDILKRSPEIKKQWTEKTQKQYAPTKYGTKNESEDFSESFVFWHNQPNYMKINPKTSPISMQKRFDVMESTIGSLKRQPTVREEAEEKVRPETLILQAYKENPRALLQSMQTEEEQYPSIEKVKEKAEYGNKTEFIPIEELEKDKSKNYIRIGKADGKNVFIKHRGNFPSVPLLNKIYKTIPDDKKVPVVMQTRKQYLEEYIDNQEKAKGVKFTDQEKRQYMDEELNKLRDVDARFTTYHNKYMEPRVVIFPQKGKINKQRIMEDVYHEYGHELWEKNKKLRKKWKFRKHTSPTLYGATDKEEDFAESYMLYKLNNVNIINNPRADIHPRIKAIDITIRDKKRINYSDDDRKIIYKRAPNPTTVSKQMNIKKEIEEEEIEDDTGKNKWGKLTTTPIADYPESFGYRGETISMSPQKFLDITHQEAKERVAKDPHPSDKWILGPREDYEKIVLRPKNIEKLKPIIASEEQEMDLPYLEYRGGIPIGHEGRHRAAAARELGFEEIPVRVIYTDKKKEEYNG